MGGLAVLKDVKDDQDRAATRQRIPVRQDAVFGGGADDRHPAARIGLV
ncbi:MAG: hypothetical protein AABM29_02835 [Actinomycetota bacterium]